MAEQDCAKMEEEYSYERNIMSELTVGTSPLVNEVIKTKSSSGSSPLAILMSKICN